MDDRELVQNLLRGDPEAQAFLDRTYRPRLYRAACHILGYKDSEAEDVVQETLLAALQQLPSFGFRSSIFRWLFQICMYKCFRVIRKRRRQVAVLDVELEGLTHRDSLDLQAAEAGEGRRKKLLEALRVEREGMGEPCREMLRMRTEGGLTYGQLAEALKVPVGTVMSRLYRCMETLRKRLAKRWKDAER